VRWPTTKDAWTVTRAQRLCWLLLLCGGLLVVLAGCASSTSTFVPVTATPCVPPTPTGGTGTCAPLVITTDRTMYAPLDAIHVTISNQLLSNGSNSVQVQLVLTGVRGCPLARAQRLEGSVWEDVPLCLPPGGGGGGAGGTSTAGERQITLPVGGHYDEFLAAGNGPADPVHRQPFPTGLYQLVFHYAFLATRDTTSVTLDGGDRNDRFVATSLPFRVCTGGVCT
jgi:hypothetical protein